MTLNDFPDYIVVGIKLSIVKDVNNNDRKLITFRLRNSRNVFQKIHTENIFGQDEIYDALLPIVNCKNGGTLPDTEKENFSNNPYCVFPHSTIVNYMFPCKCYIKQRDGSLMQTAAGTPAVTDHVQVLGMVDRIENDRPVWNSTFDPIANGARLFRNNYQQIEPNEEEADMVVAPTETQPAGNPQGGQQQQPMQNFQQGQQQGQQGNQNYQQGQQQGQGRASF